MRFVVRRASTWDEEQCPLEGAERHDHGSPGWHSTYWTIEVDGLDDMLALAQRVEKPLVVNAAYPPDRIGQLEERNYPSIEIYDDYRE